MGPALDASGGRAHGVMSTRVPRGAPRARNAPLHLGGCGKADAQCAPLHSNATPVGRDDPGAPLATPDLRPPIPGAKNARAQAS